jgi:outer membrane protein TolC
VQPQSTGTAISSIPRFIANNAVHEYSSQAQVNETIGAQQFNTVSRASASLAVATAELEIAQRGLVAGVAGLFYASFTADRRVAVAERAANEAASLTKLTQQRENGREVAHADVVKAQLQQQQREGPPGPGGAAVSRPAHRIHAGGACGAVCGARARGCGSRAGQAQS